MLPYKRHRQEADERLKKITLKPAPKVVDEHEKTLVKESEKTKVVEKPKVEEKPKTDPFESLGNVLKAMDEKLDKLIKKDEDVHRKIEGNGKLSDKTDVDKSDKLPDDIDKKE